LESGNGRTGCSRKQDGQIVLKSGKAFETGLQDGQDDSAPGLNPVNPVCPVWFSTVTPHSESRIGNGLFS
jgi:hypothetical protein